MSTLAESIESVGHEVACCALKCSGITCAAQDGRPPRCLYLEYESRAASVGSVVVGLNPGRAAADELTYYRVNGVSYRTLRQFFIEQRAFRHRYYRELRRFVDTLGLGGPVLWTELVKCENEPASDGLPPIQTLRQCAGRFLRRELELAPRQWPIIAVGREAYKASAYLVPDRGVVGVPHPTGSRGQWYSLFEAGVLRPPVEKAARLAMAGRKAAWLS